MSEKELQNEIHSMRAEIKRLRKSLTELTPPLTALLRRRGFRIYKKEPPADLLLPEERFIDDFYAMLQRYSFRLFLRDVIKHQSQFTVKDATRYATQEVTGEYIEFILKIGLIEDIGSRVRGQGSTDRVYCLIRRPVKSFGPTLEWFLSEIFRREFAMESVWGVKFKRPVVGGDYDLIAKIDSSIIYMEVKSSPPKQIYPNEVAAFLDRVFDLKPEISLFFMDTELRMKDKIVPMFEEEIMKKPLHEISSLYGTSAEGAQPPQLRRMEKELFHMYDKTFIINSKDSIVNNLEKVLSWHYRRGL